MPEPAPDPPTRPAPLAPSRGGRARAARRWPSSRPNSTRAAQAPAARPQDVLEAQAHDGRGPDARRRRRRRASHAGKTAERAVFEAFAAFRDLLAGMGGYLGERAADLDDVVAARHRAPAAASPAPGVPDPDHPFVLVARDLAPADTAMLDLDQVLALVTTDGGPTSHTAILAREKAHHRRRRRAAEPPTLADGDHRDRRRRGRHGDRDPDATSGRRRRARASPSAHARRDAPVGPGALADGTPSRCSPTSARPAGAAGRRRRRAPRASACSAPSSSSSTGRAPRRVEQQASSTRGCSPAFPGKKVVVRVLDAGADKPLAFLNDAHEENPALGLRGLRALRASEDDPARPAHGARRGRRRDRRRPLGHGADGVDRRGDRATSPTSPTSSASGPPASWSRCRRPRCSPTASSPTPTSRRSARTTSPSTRSPPTGCSARSPPSRTRGTRRCCGSSARSAPPGAAAGKPVGICGEAAADPLLAVVLVGLGATTPLDVRRRRSPTCAPSSRATPSTRPRHLAELALAADGGGPQCAPRQPLTARCTHALNRGTHHDNDVRPATRTGRARVARAAVRHVPLRHDHAQHRGLHRVGPHHRVLHPDRLDAQRHPRRFGDADVIGWQARDHARAAETHDLPRTSASSAR